MGDVKLWLKIINFFFGQDILQKSIEFNFNLKSIKFDYDRLQKFVDFFDGQFFIYGTNLRILIKK